MSETSRRTVLAGMCGAGVAAALGGCSTYGGSSDDGSANDGAAAPSATGSGPTATGGAALAKVADIPVGGGKVVDSAGTKILIVQPTAGTFNAYNAACTHQQTTVDPPVDGIMTCPNHHSRFRAADGSVVNGPAGRPLEKIALKVTGDGITLG